MGKYIIKLVIALAAGAFLGIISGLIIGFVKIFAPEYYDSTVLFFKILLWGAVCIVIFVTIILIAISTIKEFNFMKLVNNELMYNGLTKTIYDAAEKRRNTKLNRKNKTGVAYVGSTNLMINYLAYEEKYDEAINLLEEFDFNELKEKLKVESNNPQRSNMVTFFGLMDSAFALYTELKNTEKVDELYAIFYPLYNLCIAKYNYLTNVLYETKFKYHIFKEEYNEAESILDILKSNEPILYNAFMLDMFKAKNVKDKELILKTYNDGKAAAEKSVNKAFFVQAMDKKKDEILKELSEEGQS